MEAEAPTVRVDTTPSELMVPYNHNPPIFIAGSTSCHDPPNICPGLGQAPNHAGLHTRWLGYCHITSSH